MGVCRIFNGIYLDREPKSQSVVFKILYDFNEIDSIQDEPWIGSPKFLNLMKHH